MFPPANESTQVRLRVDKTQRLDTVGTEENYGLRHSGEEMLLILPLILKMQNSTIAKL